MSNVKPLDLAIIGGGPAGLMAAEAALAARPDLTVCVFEAKPSLARKFLMAGKSGLNLTHVEQTKAFLSRFGRASGKLKSQIEAFPPYELRRWADDLGAETFVGSSGRIFPAIMKASPLLRTWLRRLQRQGAEVRLNQKWLGWNEAGHLKFVDVKTGYEQTIDADATILALGGVSWPRLGSVGDWVPLLEEAGISCAPWKPANCGFEIEWSDFFKEKFGGEPVKNVRLSLGEEALRGEFVVSGKGVEGSAIYTLAAPIREAIAEDGEATVFLDLMPDRTVAQLANRLAVPRGKRSFATHMRKSVRLEGVKAALLRELAPEMAQASALEAPKALAQMIKALPLKLARSRPIEEAISVAGGVRWSALSYDLSTRERPDVYCVGEMVDWEAPTGGYLLTASMAQGRWAGNAAAEKLYPEVDEDVPDLDDGLTDDERDFAQDLPDFTDESD
ncbi:MAG: TIGR03862 family flavoprotein [Parvibaculaceae bacterium]|nr:TIGR03862 family flavoprotein [Parvibaculaceae bacterium]